MRHACCKLSRTNTYWFKEIFTEQNGIILVTLQSLKRGIARSETEEDQIISSLKYQRFSLEVDHKCGMVFKCKHDPEVQIYQPRY